jgi:hypothetical protein
MTEEEYQQHIIEFSKKLKHLPQVGKRPFGYPKLAWLMSGLCGVFGLVAMLPLVLSKTEGMGPIVSAVAGTVLFSCMFTMRSIAHISAIHAAVDRHILERLDELEKHVKSSQSV